MGKLIFTPADFSEAAVQYRQELLMIPIIGLQSYLQYMTQRPGIRYKERVGTITGDAQFAPYKSTREADFNLNLNYRTLETYFGNVVAKFEPNSAVSTILGSSITKGDGLAQTPTAKNVLTLVAQSLSKHLANAMWKAKRNENGDTTMDLFDGFDTITKAEITAGNLSASKGNYIKLTEAVTKANAVDIAKQIYRSLDPCLREQKCYLYCDYNFYDMYCEAYLLTHNATPYNQQYSQVEVEGSNGNLILCPMANKSGSKYLHITPASNMLVGYDQMGDMENVMVKDYQPFILSYVATMFFGVQFESIEKENFMAVEYADNAA